MNTDFYEDLLIAADSSAGRFLLGIPNAKGKIAKLTPNSVHYVIGREKDKVYIKAYFWNNDQVVRELLSPLEKMAIARKRGYKAFLHYSGLERLNYPSVYLNTLSQNTGAGDGYCLNQDANFTNCRSAASSTSVDYTGVTAQLQTSWVTSPLFFIGRVFLPFDTSSLTVNAVISAATLQIVGTPDASNTTSPSAYIVTTTQASTSSLATSDYSQVGSSGLSASTIDLTSSGTKTGSLNAAGIAVISKTGFTEIGLREHRDFENTAPASGGSNDVSRWDVKMSEDGTPANRPLLTITYILSGGILASEI